MITKWASDSIRWVLFWLTQHQKPGRSLFSLLPTPFSKILTTALSLLLNHNCHENGKGATLRGWVKKGLEIQCHFHTGQSRWVVCGLQRNLWEFPKVSPLHSYHPSERVKYDRMGKMPKVSNKKRRLWGRQIKWCWRGGGVNEKN